MKTNVYPACEDCCDCPPCPSPEFLCATAAASCSKCTDFPEFGTPSSPPKYYLKDEETGTFLKTFSLTRVVGLRDDPCCSTEVVEGSGGTTNTLTTTLDRPSLTGGYCGSNQSPYPPDWEYSETRTVTFTASPGCEQPPGFSCSDYDYTEGPFITTFGWGMGLGPYVETIVSNTEKRLDRVESDIIDEGPDPSGPCGCTFSSHREENYEEHWVMKRSDEHTTVILRADMLALIAALIDPALCSGSTIIASYSLSPDQVTASGKKGKYGWRHPVPPRIPSRCDAAGGGPACFRITWDRTFTPVTGSPEVTPMTYTWDGATPGGYDVADKTTWPKTPVQSEDVPTTPGTVTISNVQFFCTGCS